MSLFEFVADRAPDHRGRSANVIGDVRKLTRSEHRHRGDGDDAKLLTRQPGDDPLRHVGESQQEPIATSETEGFEPIAQPVNAPLQLTIREALITEEDRRTISTVSLCMAVDELTPHVESRRILQLWQRIAVLWKLIRTRQSLVDGEHDNRPSATSMLVEIRNRCRELQRTFKSVSDTQSKVMAKIWVYRSDSSTYALTRAWNSSREAGAYDDPVSELNF